MDLAAESRTDAKQWKSALTALLNKLQLSMAEEETQGYIPKVNLAPSPPPTQRPMPPPLSQRQVPPQAMPPPPPPPPPPSPAQAKLMLFDAVERMDTQAMRRILENTNIPIDIMDDVTGIYTLTCSVLCCLQC